MVGPREADGTAQPQPTPEPSETPPEEGGEGSTEVRSPNPPAEPTGLNTGTLTVTWASDTTLVSNLGQGDDGTDGFTTVDWRAQQVETGSNSRGYDIAGVTVDFTGSVSGTFASAIHENADVPGDEVVKLTGPPASAGEYTFTPASATTLNASTKYFVVFKKSVDGPLITKLKPNVQRWQIEPKSNGQNQIGHDQPHLEAILPADPFLVWSFVGLPVRPTDYRPALPNSSLRSCCAI